MSNLIKCPSCKTKVSLEAEACPKCGQPITEEIKNAAIKKAKKDKKSGCLLLILLLVIGIIFARRESSGAYFLFNDNEFVSQFKSWVNKPGYLELFGSINVADKTMDGKTASYALNNDAKLEIINSGDYVWQICIKYDDEKKYNEKTILGAFMASYMSFVDFGYLSPSSYEKSFNFLSRNVMSIPRNKRGTVRQEIFEFSHKENGKEIPVMELRMVPVLRSICFIAEKGASLKK